MKIFSSSKRNNTGKGFTLTEVLVTVAIIVILAGIAVPSIGHVKNTMHQSELNSKAETIYSAVQNQLIKLMTAGRAEEFCYTDGTNGILKPEDGSFCYFTSDYYAANASGVKAIMNSDTMDAELLSNSWVVEFYPNSAVVKAVFYSEEDVRLGAEAANNIAVLYSEYTVTNPDADKINQIRAGEGKNIGYYAGDGTNVSTNAVDNVAASVDIYNGDTLTADITCTSDKTPVFKVQLWDADRNMVTTYYALKDSTEEVYDENGLDRSEEAVRTIEKNGDTYTLSLVLDDPANGKSFASQYGSNLTPGESLSVAVTPMVSGDHTTTDSITTAVVTNSLFADESNNYADTAVILCARHLQNLDTTTSGVTTNIKKAIQKSDIDLTGKTFTPITNSNLTEYTAGDATLSYKISNLNVTKAQKVKYGGLFGYVNKLKVSYLTLTNPTVVAKSYAGALIGYSNSTTAVQYVTVTGAKVSVTSASDKESAGSLVGRAKNKLTVSYCQAYLTKDDIKGKTNADIWISGKYAGGLVGSAVSTLSISYSSASTVVKATETAGGLVGIASTTSNNISIKYSYADCYLTGVTVGGLVGKTPDESTGTTTISNAYAAGYMTYTDTGAGLVVGKATLGNVYTIMATIDPATGDLGETYYSTVTEGSVAEGTKAYYRLENTGLEDDALEGTEQIETEDQSLVLGKYFTRSKSKAVIKNSRAYNLMGQKLTTYTFYASTKLVHYGDWELADINKVHGLTFQVGVEGHGSVDTSAKLDVKNGTSAVEGYTAPSHTPNTDSEGEPYTLVGWYSNYDGTGTKVLDENGKIVAAVEGFTKDKKGTLVFAMDADSTLYAYWSFYPPMTVTADPAPGTDGISTDGVSTDGAEDEPDAADGVTAPDNVKFDDAGTSLWQRLLGKAEPAEEDTEPATDGATYTLNYDGNGATSGAINSYVFYHLDNNTTVTLAKNEGANKFTKKCTVTYNVNGGTLVGDAASSATATSTFLNWRTADGGKTFAAGATINAKNDLGFKNSSGNRTVTLYANWKDGTVTLPNATKSGAEFLGWYDEDGNLAGVANGSYTVTKNVTLTARFGTKYVLTDKLDQEENYIIVTKNSETSRYSPAYALTYNAPYYSGGNASLSATSIDIKRDDNGELYVVASDDKLIWQSGSGTSSYTLKSKAATSYLYMKSGSLRLTGNPSTANMSWSYNYGNNGKLCVGFSNNYIGYNYGSFGLNSGNTVYIYKEDKGCKVTLDANGGSFESGVTTPYTVDVTINSTALPSDTKTPSREGYTFEGWYTAAGTDAKKVAGTDRNFVEGITDYTNESGKWTRTQEVKLYAHWKVNQYTLTINYVCSDGKGTAPNKYTAQVDYNGTYSVASPALTGYTPDIATVTGTMDSTKGKTVTVTYNPNKYTLTINYVCSDGKGTAPNKYTAQVDYNGTYSVASPSLTGYKPNIATVSGTMDDTNGKTVLVTYTPNKYALTVEYVCSDGKGTAPNKYTAQVDYNGTYSVVSPALTGYTPDTATVTGTMDSTKGKTVKVTYNPNDYTLTVEYVCSDGKSAPAQHTEQVKYNAAYSVASPALTGYTPDTATVTGTMDSTSGKTVKVTYTPNEYTLTVKYVCSDGKGTAPSTHTEQVVFNQAYSVNSPSVTGYTPDYATVTGVMDDANGKTVTVTYSPNKISLTINYVCSDGKGVPPAQHTEQVAYNDTYSVASPALTGYTPDIATVTGTMDSTSGKTVTVTYTPNEYTLTVKYVCSDGKGIAPSTHTEQVAYNATYSVGSPSVSGYTPDIETVSGTMDDVNGKTVTVTYSPVGYTLTINYVCSDGKGTAPVQYTTQVNYNGTYSVESPVVSGYTPDIATVSGTMDAVDGKTVTVTYTPNNYTLTIVYEYEDESEAAPTEIKTVACNADYSVDSPAVPGYTPSLATVSGTMPAGNVTVNVTYTLKGHTLTIRYLYEDDTVAAEPYTKSLNYKTDYKVESPKVPHATADRLVVSGTMDDGDKTEIVRYTRISMAYTFYNGASTLTLDANGGVFGTDKETLDLTVAYYGGPSVKSYVQPTLAGHALKGWYTAKTEGALLLRGADCAVYTGVNGYTDAAGLWLVDKNTTAYAQWQPYKTDIVLNPSLTGTESGDAVIYYGETAFTTTDSFTNTGYDLEGWYTQEDGAGVKVFAGDGTCVTPVDDTYTYINADGEWVYCATEDNSLTLYANWTPTVFDVTLDPNGATAGSKITATVDYLGAALDYTGAGYADYAAYAATVANTGYTLTGWFTETDGGEKVLDKDGNILAVTGIYEDGKWVRSTDITLYAHWQANTYTLNLRNDDTAATLYQSFTETYQEEAVTTGYTQPAERPGYTFCGWYTEKNGKGSLLVMPDGSFAPNLAGYTATGTDEITRWTWAATDTVELYGYWGVKNYTITLKQGDTTYNVAKVDYGDSVLSYDHTYVNPSETGYSYGWYDSDGVLVMNGDGKLVRDVAGYTTGINWTHPADVTLYGKATPITTTFILRNGTTDYRKGTVAYKSSAITYYNATSGAAQAYTVPTKTGYALDGWYTYASNGERIVLSGGGLTTLPTTYTDNSGNWKYYAGGTPVFYAQWSYTLTYDMNGAPENASFTSQDAKLGGSIKLHAGKPTRDGYNFKGWATSKTATTAAYQPGNTYTDNGTTGNVTMYAVWEKLTYTVHYEANYSGVTNMPEDQTKNNGEDLTLSSKVPEKTGYDFLGWSEDPSAKTATYQPGDTYSEDRDITLYALWTLKTYKITYLPNADDDTVTNMPDNGTKTFGITYYISTKVPVRDGYTFLGWDKDASATTPTYPTGKSNSYTSNADLTLYAVWKANYHRLVLKSGITDARTCGDFADVAAGKTSLADYNYVKPGHVPVDNYALEGWYTAPNDTGVKILNADGSVVAGSTVENYTNGGKFALKKAVTVLYAKWTYSEYVLTDMPEEDGNYLFVNRDTAGPGYALTMYGTTVNFTGITVTRDSRHDGLPYIKLMNNNAIWTVDCTGSEYEGSIISIINFTAKNLGTGKYLCHDTTWKVTNLFKGETLKNTVLLGADSLDTVTNSSLSDLTVTMKASYWGYKVHQESLISNERSILMFNPVDNVIFGIATFGRYIRYNNGTYAVADYTKTSYDATDCIYVYKEEIIGDTFEDNLYTLNLVTNDYVYATILTREDGSVAWSNYSGDNPTPPNSSVSFYGWTKGNSDSTTAPESISDLNSVNVKAMDTDGDKVVTLYACWHGTNLFAETQSLSNGTFIITNGSKQALLNSASGNNLSTNAVVSDASVTSAGRTYNYMGFGSASNKSLSSNGGYLWNVAKSGSGYTVQSVGSGKYLNASAEYSSGWKNQKLSTGGSMVWSLGSGKLSTSITSGSKTGTFYVNYYSRNDTKYYSLTDSGTSLTFYKLIPDAYIYLKCASSALSVDSFAYDGIAVDGVTETPVLTLMDGETEVLIFDAVYGCSGAQGYVTPEREGSTLKGWFTEPEGGVMVLYPDGLIVPNALGYTDDYGLTLSGDLTLYAQWEETAPEDESEVVDETEEVEETPAPTETPEEWADEPEEITPTPKPTPVPTPEFVPVDEDDVPDVRE